MAGTAIDLMDCPRVNMKREATLLLTVLWVALAPVVALAQEIDELILEGPLSMVLLLIAYVLENIGRI